MRKIVSLFVFVIVLTFFPGVIVNADQDKHENKIISVDVTYNSWDEARQAGEYYSYDADDYNGLLKVYCAYRVGKSDKFMVTYTSEY